MATSAKKFSKIVIINNELGLHARSAAQIAKIAQNSKATVWIEKGHDKADASNILDILSLGCEKGTKVKFIIEHPFDRSILNALANLVESGFGE